MDRKLKKTSYAFEVDGTQLEVAAIQRSGVRTPIVFLHGFGSTKEDYADIVNYLPLDGRRFLAFDAPGCGEMHCTDLSKISIHFWSRQRWRCSNTPGSHAST